MLRNLLKGASTFEKFYNCNILVYVIRRRHSLPTLYNVVFSLLRLWFRLDSSILKYGIIKKEAKECKWEKKLKRENVIGKTKVRAHVRAYVEQRSRLETKMRLATKDVLFYICVCSTRVQTCAMNEENY